MRDRRAIIDLYNRGAAAVLVTLVRVEGSSYRRPGARLLIAANGDYAGAISGGCLEAEVIRKAQWLVRNGPTVQRYSTLFDDTADIPYGLGCGGTVDLLLEPTHTPECIALLEALRASLDGTPQHITTTLPTATTPLRRTIHSRLEPRNSKLDPDPFTPPARTTPWNLEPGTSNLFGNPQPELFEETLTPPQRLLIFGAGDDAQTLVRLAALLGWTAIVLDSRPQWATAARFPEADLVLATNSLAQLEITPTDAAVLMTHSYEQDRAWLAALLPRRPRYLGLLGARHRSALLLSEVATLLHTSLEVVCNAVFAPIGLDLGGDGAEAIALATIAEIQAFCEGKLNHSRRLTPTAISEQIHHGGASRYLQTPCAI